MKKTFLLLSVLSLSLPFMNGCSSDTDMIAAEQQAEAVVPAAEANPDYFPADDGAKNLSSIPVSGVAQLLRISEPTTAMNLVGMNITEGELAEIKAFVDENLKRTSGELTYKAIFNWIRSNIKYAYYPTPAYLDPYEVFTNKTCICQGYANLLRTMLYTQDIPAFGANGQLGTIGAHAWNYVYDGKTWWVSDPTNGNQFKMNTTADYKDRLIPQSLDVNLFEDDLFAYGYQEHSLNVNEVKASAPEILTVPFSIKGYKITSFSLKRPLPEHVRVLYLGKNIKNLGMYESFIREYTPGVEEVYLDPANENLEWHKGIIYRLYSNMPYYIPPRTKVIELKPMERMEKNVIVNMKYVEEIIVAEGTKILESYAIENCPALKRLYIPETLETMQENALYNCPSDVEIIRVPTGIHHVTM